MQFRRIITIFILSVLIVYCNIDIVEAANNNFLNISIDEENKDLIIKEEWNVTLKDSDLFKRELPIDESSISNLFVQQKFPLSNPLSYSKKYNTFTNSTSIDVKTNLGQGKSIVLVFEYRLALDNKTKLDFINNIPCSLSTDNTYGIKKINLSLNTNNYKYTGIVDFSINNTFTQKTSTSKTTEVFIQLFKLLINIIIIGVLCFICYVVILSIYYKNERKFKRKKELKQIKSKRKRKVSKKSYMKT